MARKLSIGLVVALATLGLASGAAGRVASGNAAKVAAPATLTVDDNKQQCPSAQYTRIRDAIQNAHAGDTVFVCAGTYHEGPGTPGTNVLEIHKDLTLKGAGADVVKVTPAVVKITPKPRHGVNDTRPATQIAENSPSIHSGKGAILMVLGKVNAPITVDVSGITFDANTTWATAGVVFMDANGSLNRSEVAGLATDESPNGYQHAGGFRSNQFGFGVVLTTRTKPPGTGTRPARTVTIDHTRIERYNAAGIVIDGRSTAAPVGAFSRDATDPFIFIRGKLLDDVIVGRNSCHHYNDFTAGGQTDPVEGRLIVGDCQPGSSVHPPLPILDGPLFGQDGVRVMQGGSVDMTDDTVSSNLVHGTTSSTSTGSPIASITSPAPAWSTTIGGVTTTYAVGNHAENNANLRLGAGVRLVDAQPSTIGGSNITDNAFGVLNTTGDGTSNNTATPVAAQNNWWGLRTGTLTLPTPGPALWPNVASPGSTFNPPVPENPVNGNPVTDADCPGTVKNSDSVDFCPYRSSTQSDSVGGEYPIPDSPIAQVDPPNCTNAATFDPNIPTYDSFFGTVLGGPATGNGRSTGTAKTTTQLMSYLQAVTAAVNANAATTGQRVAVKLYQSGSSVLGVPFYVIVVGSPDNIANLDAGRNDAAFWRGVVDGSVSQPAALAAASIRPAFGWITGTPHGNEPAGGEGSTKEMYDLVARTDCASSQRLANMDVFIQPVTNPDGRDHNVRTFAWALDPNRDRGVVSHQENRALLTSTSTYPGLFFIDAHQQSSGYFFPPNEDAALHEISHFAIDLINDVIGPGLQQQFNDQSAQYRNYNTYDLFVPEYGDTVPALIMGAAGMTYEKGTSESYGKQVYDHYLAMDATVNVIAASKPDLLKGWIPQWPEAVQQGQDCKQQGNSQVSPVVIDVL